MPRRSKPSPRDFFARHWVVAGALLLAALVLPAAGQSDLVPNFPNVPYCSPSSGPCVVAQELDIYNPTNGSPGPWPLLIHIHGGAWSTGDKALPTGASIETDLMAAGWAVASINYRLAPAYQFPAMIIDSNCAVTFLRANAAKYNFDATRFLLKGESSGAHLAMLVAVASANAAWNVNDWPGASTAVNGVWDGYGPTDLSQPDMIATLGGLLQEVFGTTDPTTLLADSPVNYLSAQSPPFMIVQGELDATIPVSQAIELDQDLLNLDVPVDLVLVAGAGHELAQVNASEPIVPSLNQIYSASDTFLEAVPPGSTPSFSLGPPSSTQAVSPGQTVTYPVTVTAAGGFAQSAQTVMLTCSGAPTGSTCTVPGSVTLDGTTPGSVSVTVTTTGSLTSLARPAGFGPSRRSLAMWLALGGLPGIVIVGISAVGSGTRRRRVLHGLALLSLLGAGIALSACGGASASNPNASLGSGVTPADGYNLTVVGTYTSGSTALISTAQLTLTVQ
jgi:acetyl esterase/lipase